MNRAQRRASLANGRKLIKQGWNKFEDATPEAIMRGIPLPVGLSRIWKNNVYTVQEFPKKSEWGDVTLLMVRRHDQEPIRSWSDMQRIKNELAGPERTAVEVYPAESKLVDQANLYWMWVLPADFKLPLNL